MNEWDSYVKGLIKNINENKEAGAVVLGVTGSKEKRKERLRVYMNGGCVLQIPLKESMEFVFGNSYFEKKDKDKKVTYCYYDYLDENEISNVQDIINQIKENPHAWKGKDNDYLLLDQYLHFMKKATGKKYNESKSNSGLKERSEQINFYKKQLTRVLEGFPWAIVDVEFQTIEKMNYSSEEEIQKRKAEQKEIHRSKPDFVAVTEDGFLLVELKTNAKACEGKAGLKDHTNDLKELIRINEQNHYIVEELQDRLRYVDKYQLYNNNRKNRNVVKGLLNKYSKDLKLYDKYLFISNEALFPKEIIEEIVKKHNIKKEEYVVL